MTVQTIQIWKWKQNFWQKNLSYLHLNISRTKTDINKLLIKSVILEQQRVSYTQNMPLAVFILHHSGNW